MSCCLFATRQQKTLHENVSVVDLTCATVIRNHLSDGRKVETNGMCLMATGMKGRDALCACSRRSPCCIEPSMQGVKPPASIITRAL
jgi:hypothetical protein